MSSGRGYPAPVVQPGVAADPGKFCRGSLRRPVSQNPVDARNTWRRAVRANACSDEKKSSKVIQGSFSLATFTAFLNFGIVDTLAY